MLCSQTIKSQFQKASKKGVEQRKSRQMQKENADKNLLDRNPPTTNLYVYQDNFITGSDIEPIMYFHNTVKTQLHCFGPFI